jgi:hypothetical protein
LSVFFLRDGGSIWERKFFKREKQWKLWWEEVVGGCCVPRIQVGKSCRRRLPSAIIQSIASQLGAGEKEPPEPKGAENEQSSINNN